MARTASALGLFFMTGCAVWNVGELSICVFGHRGDARWFNELQHKLISTIVDTGDFVVALLCCCLADLKQREQTSKDLM